MRRVYLDLVGLPPAPEQVRAFLSDRSPSRTKREALADRLVGSPEFVEHWTNKWADLLGLATQVSRREGNLGVPELDPRRGGGQRAVRPVCPHAAHWPPATATRTPAASYYRVSR